MLSDEEKILIKKLRYCEQEYEQNGYLSVGKFEAIKEASNLIEKQSKEIEHQKEKRENQRQELAILNAKQIEFNKLVNTVNSYKGQFKKQQKEIEELKEDNKKKSIVIIEYQDLYEKLQDKIKAKIEEVNAEELNLAFIISGVEYKEAITSVLQSLLEKE